MPADTPPTSPQAHCEPKPIKRSSLQRVFFSSKWLGAFLAIVLLLVWIINGKWGVTIVLSQGDCVEVDGGIVTLNMTHSGYRADTPGWYLIHHQAWWWDDQMQGTYLNQPPGWFANFPIWMPLTLIIWLFAPIWIIDVISRNRVRRHHAQGPVLT